MLHRFFTMFQGEDEEGQGLIEYALIILLVAIAVVATVRILGSNVNTIFSTIATNLGTAGS